MAHGIDEMGGEAITWVAGMETPEPIVWELLGPGAADIAVGAGVQQKCGRRGAGDLRVHVAGYRVSDGCRWRVPAGQADVME